MTKKMGSRVFTVVVAAIAIISTGCAHNSTEATSQFQQSIFDGLNSAAASLVEAALLSLVL